MTEPEGESSETAKSAAAVDASARASASASAGAEISMSETDVPTSTADGAAIDLALRTAPCGRAPGKQGKSANYTSEKICKPDCKT